MKKDISWKKSQWRKHNQMQKCDGVLSFLLFCSFQTLLVILDPTTQPFFGSRIWPPVHTLFQFDCWRIWFRPLCCATQISNPNKSPENKMAVHAGKNQNSCSCSSDQKRNWSIPSRTSSNFESVICQYIPSKQNLKTLIHYLIDSIKNVIHAFVYFCKLSCSLFNQVHVHYHCLRTISLLRMIRSTQHCSVWCMLICTTTLHRAGENDRSRERCHFFLSRTIQCVWATWVLVHPKLQTRSHTLFCQCIWQGRLFSSCQLNFPKVNLLL